MIIVILQLQFADAIRKEEITNTISEDVVCSLDIERFLNLGIWSADKMEEDQSRDQCRDDYVYREVSFSVLQKRMQEKDGTHLPSVSCCE